MTDSVSYGSQPSADKLLNYFRQPIVQNVLQRADENAKTGAVRHLEDAIADLSTEFFHAPPDAPPARAPLGHAPSGVCITALAEDVHLRLLWQSQQKLYASPELMAAHFYEEALLHFQNGQLIPLLYNPVEQIRYFAIQIQQYYLVCRTSRERQHCTILCLLPDAGQGW